MVSQYSGNNGALIPSLNGLHAHYQSQNNLVQSTYSQNIVNNLNSLNTLIQQMHNRIKQPPITIDIPTKNKFCCWSRENRSYNHVLRNISLLQLEQAQTNLKNRIDNLDKAVLVSQWFGGTIVAMLQIVKLVISEDDTASNLSINIISLAVPILTTAISTFAQMARNTALEYEKEAGETHDNLLKF
jgi:hypothetical protein